MDAEQSSKADKPLSILERFRQLSKDKEKEKLEASKPKPAPTVSAIYLSKNDKTSPSQKFGNDRGWKQNKWGDSNNRHDQRRGGWGRGGGGRGRGRDRGWRDGGGDGGERGWKRKEGEYNSRDDNQEQKEKSRAGELISIKESDVGITEYANQNLTGFTGILKQRFSDFNVNEIAKDGTVVKLTSLDVPEFTPMNNAPPDFKLTDDSDLLKVLKKELWEELYAIVASEETSRSVEIEVTNMSKEDRVKIHNAIKSLFKTNVNSNTVDKGDKKILKISYVANENQNKIRRNWTEGEFLHFVLYKENTDTSEAINLIAAKLRIKPSSVMYAGIKDKRARTTQAMCIRRMFPNKMAAIQPFRTITIGNYCFKKKALRLGSHYGNRFRIAIRNVLAEESLVAANVASLQETGFINYFGLQRFGQSVTSPTYLVGKAIVNRNWKEAVEVVLRPRPGERSYADVAEARDVWWKTRCSKSALKTLRSQTSGIEKKIWQTLADQHENAYLNALESLPRSTLSLYCHSFQSLIWNRVVSRRIKELGHVVLPGDLVVVEDEKDGVGKVERGDCGDGSVENVSGEKGMVVESEGKGHASEEQGSNDWNSVKCEREGKGHASKEQRSIYGNSVECEREEKGHASEESGTVERSNDGKSVGNEKGHASEEQGSNDWNSVKCERDGKGHASKEQRSIYGNSVECETEEKGHASEESGTVEESNDGKSVENEKGHASEEDPVEPVWKVRHLTEEEAKVTSIDKIVYPLPGSQITLPDNIVGEFYREALAEEGVTMDSFKNEGSANKTLTSMYGTYRNIVVKPTDLSWKLVNYKDFSDDLFRSELDELRGNGVIEHPETGSHRGLLLEFSLGSSSYATMLLRELMRCGTSSTFHANLTAKEANSTAKEVEVEGKGEEEEGPVAKRVKKEEEENGEEQGGAAKRVKREEEENGLVEGS